MGINFLLRKSEHIGSMDKLPISRKAITFFDTYDQAIPYQLVGLDKKAHSVLANIQYPKLTFSEWADVRDTQDRMEIQTHASYKYSLYHIPGLEKIRRGHATSSNFSYSYPGRCRGWAQETHITFVKIWRSNNDGCSRIPTIHYSHLRWLD